MKGEHIKVRRWFYTHHGIDMGDGTVIHFFGEPGAKTKRKAQIVRTSLEDFLKGGRKLVVKHVFTMPLDVIAARAASSLGLKGYDAIFNNCEHFARWCTGEDNPRSTQVERSLAALLAVGALFAKYQWSKKR